MKFSCIMAIAFKDGRTDEVRKEGGSVRGHFPTKGLEPCLILLICPTKKSPKR